MMRTLWAGIILAIVLFLATQASVIGQTVAARYNTITSMVVLETKTTSSGLEVVGCEVVVEDFQ